MNYELIDELIDAIKQEDVYKEYVIAREQVLNNEKIVSDIHLLNSLENDYQELKKYGSYINNDELKEKLSLQKKKIDEYSLMKTYKQKSHQLNLFLDEMTQIIFKDISSELEIGRLGKMYARYRR